jgi:hypothetical protein
VTSVRRFALDEVLLRPGTYFNPETEVMIVVDDSPEVDHEIFEAEDLESSDWVLLGDEVPVDETRRDDIVERFQRTHTSGEGKILHDGEEEEHGADEDDDLDHDLDADEEEEEDVDELEAVEDLDYERE